MITLLIIQLIAFILIINITRNTKLHYLLLIFINLVIIAKFNIQFISSLFDNFKNIEFIINLIVLLSLIYLINELLNFTNFSKSFDNFMNNKIKKFKDYIFLFLSAFNSNVDFSSSKLLTEYNFYNYSFLMSSINVISILSLEILFIIIFINSSYSYIWLNFFLLNFFVFIWIFKKILDIKNDNVIKYKYKSYYKKVFLNKHKDNGDIEYDSKYNLNYKKVLTILSITILLLFVFVLIFNIDLFSTILLFFLTIFILLTIYIYILIYKTSFISEKKFYVNLFSNLKFLLNHLVEILLALIFLHSNLIIYNIFNNSSLNNSLFIFIFIIILSIIFTILSYSYMLPLVLVTPLTLAYLNNIDLIFLYSLIIILFNFKSIKGILKNSSLLKEFSVIIIGGLLSFFIAFNFSYLLSLAFLILYLFLMKLFYNKLFLESKKDA